MRIITTYQCGYCSETFTFENMAQAHESKCTCNPALKHCNSCRFLISKCPPFIEYIESGAGSWDKRDYCEHHEAAK